MAGQFLVRFQQGGNHNSRKLFGEIGVGCVISYLGRLNLNFLFLFPKLPYLLTSWGTIYWRIFVTISCQVRRLFGARKNQWTWAHTVTLHHAYPLPWKRWAEELWTTSSMLDAGHRLQQPLVSTRCMWRNRPNFCKKPCNLNQYKSLIEAFAYRRVQSLRTIIKNLYTKVMLASWYHLHLALFRRLLLFYPFHP